MDDQRAHALISARRAELEAIRAELATRVEQADGAETSTADQHPADTATETADRTADLSLHEQVMAELLALDRAEQRIRGGVYGSCEVCEEPIPDERLEALPGTRRCVRHEKEAEA